MNIKDFKKGDKAYILHNDKLREVEISRVGRKFVYVGGANFANYVSDKMEGLECVYNSDMLFKSLQDYEDFKEHKVIARYVRDAFAYDCFYKYSLAKLRKIKEILESD